MAGDARADASARGGLRCRSVAAGGSRKRDGLKTVPYRKWRSDCGDNRVRALHRLAHFADTADPTHAGDATNSTDASLSTHSTHSTYAADSADTSDATNSVTELQLAAAARVALDAR